MELKIYNSKGTLKLTVSPSSSSTVTEEVMGEYCVCATFVHTEFVVLDVNDYVLVDGVKYKLRRSYKPEKKNSQCFNYQVKFHAPIHDAEDALFLFMADDDYQTEFSFDGTPQEHLQLWVDNMNRIAGSSLWSIGTVITGESKTIDYRNVYCWEAAFGSNGIAATFDTELWADGFVINLCKASRGVPVTLGYMQGLKKLQRSYSGNKRFFTRLFPLGSTRNIDATKYGSARLQLPSKAKYVDRNTELYGIKDAYEEAAFADIYPKYVGKVTAVRTGQKKSPEGRDYTVYYFQDNGMDFDPSLFEIPELVKMVSFQTGDLAGHGDKEGAFQANWDPKRKEWEIINVYPDETTQIPGGTLIPKVGDSYIPWNFRMPDSYLTAAEQAYQEAVNHFVDTYSFDPDIYTAPTDRNYIENNQIPLQVGQNVVLASDEYFRGIKETRITKVVRKLNDLNDATITCTDKIANGWKAEVENSLTDLHYKLSQQLQQTLIDIIRTGDTKTASDYNVFSALKSLMTFLRKDRPDETSHLLKLLGGAHFGKFTSGLLGSGGAVTIDKDGNSHAEFDYLTIRKIAHFIELLVQEMRYVGGSLVLSPAGMKVSKVEEQPTAYRCYFESTDGDRMVKNQFTIGSQARRQTFDLSVGQAYYWRLVTAVGNDYIDLSKTDADTGSTIPAIGDELVELGHRNDKMRQAAIIISAYGDGSPSIRYYQGINSYSLVDKVVKSEEYDHTTGRFKSTTFGDAYIGARDRSTYVEYDQENGLGVKGKVNITEGSTGWKNLDGLPNEIGEASKTANQAAQDAKTAKDAAVAASKDASNAKDRLNEWASDSKISPTEKLTLQQEMKQLEAEYADKMDECRKYGITETSAYTAAWNAYKAQLVAHSAATPENIPIAKEFSTTQTTFYKERTSLLALIASKAKEYVDASIDKIGMGAVNILRNSGFAGNYESEQLTGDSVLSDDTQLYSKQLEHWSGIATIAQDDTAVSGYAASIGMLSQSVKLIVGENYVISYHAKGSQLAISCGNFSVSQSLSSSYKRYVHKFNYAGSGTFAISGTAVVCNLQLERGTIATDWSPSPMDTDKAAAKYMAVDYIASAMKNGSVDVLGGLILATMIQLGNYKDGKLQEVTAGVSGIFNDGDDVAFWAGGTYEKAIRTVMKFKNDPHYKPTDSDWSNLANFVATHGGDLFMRGYIYALGGMFRGTVFAEDGEFNGAVNLKAKGGKIVLTPEDQYGFPCIDIYDREGAHLAFITVGLGTTGDYEPRVALFSKDEKRELNLRPDLFTIEETRSNNKHYRTEIGGGRIAMTESDVIKWEQSILPK